MPFAPDEQLLAQLLFQLHQLLGKGGLGNVQRLRRAGDVSFLRHGQKVTQYTDLHSFLLSCFPQYSIRNHSCKL